MIVRVVWRCWTWWSGWQSPWCFCCQLAGAELGPGPGHQYRCNRLRILHQTIIIFIIYTYDNEWAVCLTDSLLPTSRPPLAVLPGAVAIILLLSGQFAGDQETHRHLQHWPQHVLASLLHRHTHSHSVDIECVICTCTRCPTAAVMSFDPITIPLNIIWIKLRMR